MTERDRQNDSAEQRRGRKGSLREKEMETERETRIGLEMEPERKGERTFST